MSHLGYKQQFVIYKQTVCNDVDVDVAFVDDDDPLALIWLA